MKKHIARLSVVILFAFLAGACAPQAEEPPASGEQGKVKVVATTTIVADVVARVGGAHIDMSVLLPVGADPHSFEPTPQDVASVADADLVFANGAGLEAFLDSLMESAGAAQKMVHVSEGIALREFAEKHDDEHEGEEHEGEKQHHDGGDPHTWTDPNNVMIWVENIASALGEHDPANAESYTANAAAYTTELQALDAWIREQVAQIPEENRKIVTDHTILGYFADEYSFTQVGALIAGYSTLAEPTAKELAEIEDAIHDLEVRAIFVGNTVNPSLAERVVEDTGVRLVYFYTGSLSEPGGDAGSYLDYMRYNVGVIVEALAE